MSQAPAWRIPYVNLGAQFVFALLLAVFLRNRLKEDEQ